MMSRKSAVDHLVNQDVPARQAVGQLDDHLTGGTIPWIPCNGQRAGAIVVAGESLDVLLSDGVIGILPARALRLAEPQRNLTQLPNRCSVKRLAAKNELEAVKVR